MIKFALIKERKTPPDRRVVFSPQKLKEAVEKFPEASFKVESSDIRIFSDQEYRDAGFEVSEDVSDCDVMLGVKEVPIPALIPNKKYFFFSHTIKKQPYNRDLLREILKNNIELYDHEVIVNETGGRLIGFGRYAGLVGAYNGIRGIGLKNDIFALPKAESLPDLNAMLAELDKISLPPLKIVLTGSGKVAHGAKEILDHLKIKQVGVEEYLEGSFQEPVYCHIDVLDYNKRKDGKEGSAQDFYTHPENYESDFLRFAKASDFFIAGHFYGEGAPVFYTAEDMKSPAFKIKYVADISCDIAGPIASTIRPSTIAEPFYGYSAESDGEVDFSEKSAIAVMAVDNLPCELPKDASEGFGDMFLKNVLPAFFDGDKDGILERARMTKDGKLTERFKYLQDYVDAGQ
ncbi:Alanine dehydrogenase [Salinimicrobium catena]|uniref:Saccharopine dehydrogenase [NAD(+), L-lysine-forming] n=1 Tax=Salinimicrobium catena TaxID=390640 RepID=A0A1H5NQ41_9FLAO|nr:NAD(P)-dependent oxidoreductase [Salinimicrobium catena]SDL55443.1 Alanine dehydrogenase [Salinimicrobium catena]SEF03554.1 Alanine dehydrogenase [Salinimicrobium catena]